MNITKLLPGDPLIDDALSLAMEVFTECEAPLYGEEGMRSFLSFVRGQKLRDRIMDGTEVIFICEEDNIILGMAALRDGSHISLAFVKSGYRGKGIGKAIFKALGIDTPGRIFTVNAALPAYGFYKKMGFVPTDIEKIEDGLIFTPMKKM